MPRNTARDKTANEAWDSGYRSKNVHGSSYEGFWRTTRPSSEAPARPDPSRAALALSPGDGRAV